MGFGNALKLVLSRRRPSARLDFYRYSLITAGVFLPFICLDTSRGNAKRAAARMLRPQSGGTPTTEQGQVRVEPYFYAC